MTNKICFECGKEAFHEHHPIPHSLGGTRTIDLCHDCHGKIHGIDFTDHGNLIKQALQLRKLAGLPVGRPKTWIDPRVVRKINQLWKRGASLDQIALITGINRCKVWRVAQGRTYEK